MNSHREYLIRSNFELERDYFYVKFRAHHWNDPAVVGTMPNEKERERILRDFWNQDAEKRYPEYRKAVAGLCTAELENERERWIEALDCLGMLEYQKQVREAAHRAANDNDRGHER